MFVKVYMIRVTEKVIICHFNGLYTVLGHGILGFRTSSCLGLGHILKTCISYDIIMYIRDNIVKQLKYHP